MRRVDLVDRFVRLRTKRFCLGALPPDVLGHVATFLADADLQSLVHALVGCDPDLQCRAHVDAVPVEMRAAWVDVRVMRDLDVALRALTDKCMYLARDCNSALAVLDWSPYTRRRIDPVAEYCWSAQAPHARVSLNRAAMRRAVLRSHRTRRPYAQVAVYMCLRWNGRVVVKTAQPMHFTTLPLIPHFVSSPCGPPAWAPAPRVA